MSAQPLLQIKELVTKFRRGDTFYTAVKGISLEVHEGETVGIVGESGSGKSVTSLSVMKLIPNPPGKISSGNIFYTGRDGVTRDLVSLPENDMRKIRGNEVA